MEFELSTVFQLSHLAATRDVTQLTVCTRFTLRRFAAVNLAVAKRPIPIACSLANVMSGADFRMFGMKSVGVATAFVSGSGDTYNITWYISIFMNFVPLHVIFSDFRIYGADVTAHAKLRWSLGHIAKSVGLKSALLLA